MRAGRLVLDTGIDASNVRHCIYVAEYTNEMPSTMGWQGCSALVVILALTQPGESSPAQAREPIQDHFAKDWVIDGNNTLVYSRTFNRHHEFGYVTCTKLDKVCKIHVVHADSSDYRTRTCAMRYDLITGKSGDMALYLPDDADVDSERVVQAWWLKGDDASDTRLTALHMRSCMNAGFDITPVAGHPSRSRVVAYRYPNFDLVYSDAGRRDKRVMFVSFEDRKYRRPWDLGVDQKYMYEEKGVEIGSSRGFFYVSTDGEPDWKLRVMFANSSAKELRKLAVVEGLRDATRLYPKTSGAHQKYGLCWKSLDRDDTRVNCTQFKIDGRRSVGEMSLLWPGTIDWLAVHNLEEPAMLLVAGKCDGGKCKEYSVTKVDANGRRMFVTKIEDLNAECPAAPFDLSMDVVEDLDRNLMCFNFVCLSTRYRESSAEKANVTMQYRRHCIGKDFIGKVA